MAGIGGMTPAVAAQVTTLLTNPLLPQQSRAFLMSPGFANATTAQQQATLAGYAQQVALAAAAPAPAAAAPTHQDNVNTAQNDAAASRIALGLPQCHCHCHFPRSLSSTQSASGSSTGSTAPRAIKTDVRARRGRSGKASLLEYRAGRRRQHADRLVS
jgi:hypothetical protein